MTAAVKKLAIEAGFARVGIASIEADLHVETFRAWLARGYHAGLDYMVRVANKRSSPKEVFEGARSVICLAAAYGQQESAATTDAFVARYARGRDYHKVLQRRCRRLMDRIREITPGFEGRASLDSAMMAERSLAAAAGVGWIGRNGCLVVPGLGSYVLLCQIVCNLDLQPDRPIPSTCRNCRACVQACPTGAITEDGLVDCRLCISYHTIENRGEIPPHLHRLMGACVFGCDACQEACPHNRDVPAGDAELTGQGPPLGGACVGEILKWRWADWDRATRGSATRRATHEMFVRNAKIAAENLARRRGP